MFRVAKCHAYDGYISVKILAGWGKVWENVQFSKIKPFLGKICTTY